MLLHAMVVRLWSVLLGEFPEPRTSLTKPLSLTAALVSQRFSSAFIKLSRESSYPTRSLPRSIQV